MKPAYSLQTKTPMSAKRSSEADDEQQHKRRGRTRSTDPNGDSSQCTPSTASPGGSSDTPTTPDLVRRASTTILSSIGASRSKPLSSLSPQEEQDLRQFYLHLMVKREREGWSAVEGVLMQVAEEMRAANQIRSSEASSSARSSDGSSSSSGAPKAPLSYVVSRTGPAEGVPQQLTPDVILCGRLADCHCVVGHEELEGKVVENLLVSRVQFIMMRLGDELVVLDCWSVCGTRTVRRQQADAVMQSSRPGARATLLFGAAESFTLEVAKDAQITFNPTADDLRVAAERAGQARAAQPPRATPPGPGTTQAAPSSSSVDSAGTQLTIDTAACGV